jgi:hypothetical protein
MGAVMSDFEQLWNVVMSEASARLEALSDEEIERIFNDELYK